MAEKECDISKHRPDRVTRVESHKLAEKTQERPLILQCARDVHDSAQRLLKSAQVYSAGATTSDVHLVNQQPRLCEMPSSCDEAARSHVIVPLPAAEVPCDSTHDEERHERKPVVLASCFRDLKSSATSMCHVADVCPARYCEIRPITAAILLQWNEAGSHI